MDLLLPPQRERLKSVSTASWRTVSPQSSSWPVVMASLILFLISAPSPGVTPSTPYPVLPALSFFSAKEPIAVGHLPPFQLRYEHHEAADIATNSQITGFINGTAVGIDVHYIGWVLMGWVITLAVGLAAFLLYRYRSLTAHHRQLTAVSEELRITRDTLVQLRAKLAHKAQPLAQLSITDPLTQIYNRLHLDDILRRETARCSRYDTHLSVILLDVDHFQAIRNQYGPSMSEHVLRQVAAILCHYVRKTDIPGRWRDAEFIVICPETDLDGTERLAILLNRRLHRIAMGTMGRITASFGVAAYRCGESETELMARADQALYQAQVLGKDRVEVVS